MPIGPAEYFKLSYWERVAFWESIVVGENESHKACVVNGHGGEDTLNGSMMAFYMDKADCGGDWRDARRNYLNINS
jgi:hypothetical protein